MQRQQTGDALVIALTLIVVFISASMICLAHWMAYASCNARWSRSGLPVSWGPIQGCLVQMPSGRWVPDDRVRDLEINNKQ